jgi:hypothetical protein
MGPQIQNQPNLFHVKRVGVPLMIKLKTRLFRDHSQATQPVKPDQAAMTSGRIQTIQRSTSSPGTVNGST